MIIVALSPVAIGNATSELGGQFVDDDVTIHQSSIEAIATVGITRGCNPPLNTRFCPEAPVSRGEMAAFLVRALTLDSAPSAGFSDTTDLVFAADIDSLASAGITRGCNPPQNSKFCPEMSVSRGQMAAFLSRALDLPSATGDSFSDDDGSMFEQDIERLRHAEITRGCNPPANDHYCPNLKVTRAEMATFLARALDLDRVEVAPRPYVTPVVPRQEWGAKPARTSSLRSHTIDQLTIHHSDDESSASGPALYQIWQSWHMHLGWPDVAYHFFVGDDGQIYEGRSFKYRGDTATEYDPTGHLLVVVEGDYDLVEPSAEQLEALAQLTAWASMQFDIPVEDVGGHRDHAATTCPGDKLYAHLHDGSVAQRAREILSEGGVTLTGGAAG